MKKMIVMVIAIFILFVSQLSYGKNVLIIGLDAADPRVCKAIGIETRWITTMSKVTVTIPGWMQVMTGMMPFEDEVYTNEEYVTVPWEKTMLSILKANGYKLGWFVSKPFLANGAYRSIYKNLDGKSYRPPSSIDGGDSAYLDVLKADLLTFIENCGTTPWFAFMHLNPDFYGHGEWQTFHRGPIPPEHVRRSRYLLEIQRCFALIDEITNSIDMQNTILIITSDHGWDLDVSFEDDTTQTASPPERDVGDIFSVSFGHSHYNAPWCIYLSSNINDSRVVYHIDIPVAILKELGLSIPDWMRSSL